MTRFDEANRRKTRRFFTNSGGHCLIIGPGILHQSSRMPSALKKKAKEMVPQLCSNITPLLIQAFKQFSGKPQELKGPWG